jgi:hypothetical protein
MQRALRAPAQATDAVAADLSQEGPAEATDAAATQFHQEGERSDAGTAPIAGAQSSLHDRLFAAWSKKDWAALAVAARRHPSARGPAPALHPITEAAIAFFRPWATDLQAGDTERFLRRIGDDGLRTYFAEEAEQERGRLADDALALHCLGMLGGAPFDYAAALRAIEALTVSARLMDLGADELGISAELIRRIGEMEVFLPQWSFEIDVCRHSDSAEGWPRESPLERKLDRLERRAAKLAQPDDCICEREDVCTPTDPCCAEVHYYVAELLELRDWTHRYKAGDIAYIENVAVGETRSREHEMKRTRELFSETEITQRQSETRDLQVTDRASLKREIERQKEQSFSGEASASGTFTGTGYSATVSASASFARSSSEAIREAQENAIETVKKAVSEIEKETRTKRSEKITTEETEKNLHKFENAGEEALVTNYFWVTKECRAQLYSYGKQMIAEFIVPEPARLYEHLVKARRDAEIARRVPPPLGKRPKPRTLSVDAAEITEENYKSLCDDWGIKDPPKFPLATQDITLWEGTAEEMANQTPLNTLHFDIPPGYVGTAIHIAGDATYRGPFGWPIPTTPSPLKVQFSLPGGMLEWSPGGNQRERSYAPPLTGSFDVHITSWNTTHVDSWTTLRLVRQPSAVDAWQKSVFELIETRYEAALATYLEKMKPWDAYDAACEALERELIGAERSRHPFFNREIERTELKRAVIYLMCQDFSVDGAMIRKAEPCGFPEIDRTATDREGYDWYFWDRLIDWKRMAFAFFDYFWNPICDWPQRFDPDEPDALFKAFRRAGYARVLVPVSPAMRKDFLWYLATHEKWNQQGPPFGDQDPRWRNVVFELEQANEAAMTAREGRLDVANGSDVVTIKGSDRYYSPAGTGLPDPAMIALDIDREVYIDGEVYLIAGIVPHPGSPPYNVLTPNSGWWQVVLDRPFEGASGTGRLYAMGARAVAPAFSFDMPTELIWAGDKGRCLPTYPLPACAD